MELKRSSILKYLDDGMENSNYRKSVMEKNGGNTNWQSNILETLKTMTLKDLDFIEVLMNLFDQIKKSYNMFISNTEWVPSDRQKCLLSILERMIDSSFGEECIGKNYNYYLYNLQDFYWESYDYFHDYGNKNEQICKEEIDLIIPHFEAFFTKVWKE